MVSIRFTGNDTERFDALKIDASGLSSRERERLGADVNESVFFSAKVSDAKLLEQMRDYISRAARGESGYHRDDFIKRMRRALGLKPNQGGTRIGDITSFQRLELIYEHNLRKINGRNQYLAAAKDADIAPARELYRSQERKVPRNWIRRWREAGGKFYGGNGAQRMIAPFFSDVWTKISRFGTPFPPFDFNSGMWTRPVSAREASELGVLTEKDLSRTAQTAPQQAARARETQDEADLGATAELPGKLRAPSVEPQAENGDGGQETGDGRSAASGEQVGDADAERDGGADGKSPAREQGTAGSLKPETGSLNAPETYLPKVVARTNAEATAALKEQQGKTFVNAETGIEANIARKQRDKLVSNAAAEKSEANGFTREQHLTAAANVGELFERAYLFEERDDYNGEKEVKSIKRFASLLVLDGKPVEADILVKESVQHGSRIYTVELQQIKKPPARGTESIKTGNHDDLPPTTDGRDKIAELAEKINGKISLLSAGAFVALLYKSRFGDSVAESAGGDSLIRVGSRGVAAGAAFDSARGARFSASVITPENVRALEETAASRAVNVYRRFVFSETLTREQAKLCAMLVERPQRVDYSRAGARFVFSRACGEKTHYAFGAPQDGETLQISYGGEKAAKQLITDN